MALDADEFQQRIDNVTTDLAADLRGLWTELEAVLADTDVHDDATVQQVLAGFATVAERLENLPADILDHESEDPESSVAPQAPIDTA